MLVSQTKNIVGLFGLKQSNPRFLRFSITKETVYEETINIIVYSVLDGHINTWMRIKKSNPRECPTGLSHFKYKI